MNVFGDTVEVPCGEIEELKRQAGGDQQENKRTECTETDCLLCYGAAAFYTKKS